MRDLKPKYFLPPQKFISCRNTVLFFAYIKINKFPEGTTCRQKTYTNASIFFRYCYKLAVFFLFSLNTAFVSADKKVTITMLHLHFEILYKLRSFIFTHNLIRIGFHTQLDTLYELCVYEYRVYLGLNDT